MGVASVASTLLARRALSWLLEQGPQATHEPDEMVHVAVVVLIMQEASAQGRPAADARGRQVRLAARADRRRHLLIERIERRFVQLAARRPVAEIHDRER